MTKEEKREYNRQHYLKNRDKILKKSLPKSEDNLNSNVFPISPGSESNKASAPTLGRSKFKLSFDTLFLQILALAMTYFLITEMAAFYYGTDGNKAEAYLKALILEGAAIALLIIRTHTFLQKIIRKSTIAAIYVYSVWLISNNSIHSAIHSQRAAEIKQQSIKELEFELSKSRDLRNHYFKTERTGLVRKYDQSLNKLREKLNEENLSFTNIPDPITIWNTLAAMITFRVLIMICNLLCIQELARRQSAV